MPVPVSRKNAGFAGKSARRWGLAPHGAWHRSCDTDPVELDPQRVRDYLVQVLGRPIEALEVLPLAGTPSSLKEFGYGIPLALRFQVDGKPRSAVLETIRPGPFGHEHRSDRAAAQLWSYESYKNLPRHVPALDVGAFDEGGRLVSLGSTGEFFVLMEFVEGREYVADIDRIRRTDDLSDRDVARADALCDYLVEIHRRRGTAPGLYARRVRELLGHGECIMGLADSYPSSYAVRLEAVEQRCVSWRWKVKERADRLRQVHGDFHPWNVLFREGTDFTVLDRSRGEWGEPADDLTCMTMNYAFFSLQRSGRVEGALKTLFDRFWERYMRLSGDAGVCEVAAPFLVMRALVMASPVWYPKLPTIVRERLFTLMERVLDSDVFDPARINADCGVCYVRDLADRSARVREIDHRQRAREALASSTDRSGRARVGRASKALLSRLLRGRANGVL